MCCVGAEGNECMELLMLDRNTYHIMGKVFKILCKKIQPHVCACVCSLLLYSFYPPS